MELDVEVFKALSDHNRIHILEMLSSGEMCANEIMKGLSLTQPTISQSYENFASCRFSSQPKEWQVDELYTK